MNPLDEYKGTEDEGAKLEDDIREILGGFQSHRIDDAMLCQIKALVHGRLMEEVAKMNLPTFEDRWRIIVERDPKDPSAINVAFEEVA